MTKRLLIVYAHPDDESFGIGSAIAKYTAEGVEATLICATNGDVGTIAAEHMGAYQTVAEVRLAELDCAAQILGFKEVITFGYRDSGMMHSPENDHPDSLWQAPLDRLTAQVGDVMRRVRPQVVITFDPFGGYGHPDHIKIHQATLAAFQALKPEVPALQKLYYASFPRTMLRLGLRLMALRGVDTRHMGVNHDLDYQAVVEHMLPTHARINVWRYQEIGRRAAACHASQMNPRQGFIGSQIIERLLTRYTSFTRADPPPQPGERLETDLFSGVRENG